MKIISNILASKTLNGLAVFALVSLAQGASLAKAEESNSGNAYTADLENGELLYEDICLSCHGHDGQGGPAGGAPIKSSATVTEIIGILKEGRNDMPSFADFFYEEEFEDVATYVVEVLVKE